MSQPLPPDDLRRLLVGDGWHSPGQGDARVVRGLLQRAGDLVEAYLDYGKPSYVTGSIIGTGGNHWDSDNEDAPMDLAVALIEFLGSRKLGTAPPSVQRDLVAYLKRHRKSDVEYVCGDSQKKEAGKIKEARDRARSMLASESPKDEDVQKCWELALWLRDFLGQKCFHSFEDGKCQKCEALLDSA